MDAPSMPFVTLTMHQLAKAIASALSDYALMTDRPFDANAGRIALMNGLDRLTQPAYRASTDVANTVLPLPRGEL